MKVKEMIQQLTDLNEPEMELWTVKDAEGNGYNETYYSPTVMLKGGEKYDVEMKTLIDLEDDEKESDYTKVVVI